MLHRIDQRNISNTPNESIRQNWLDNREEVTSFMDYRQGYDYKVWRFSKVLKAAWNVLSDVAVIPQLDK